VNEEIASNARRLLKTQLLAATIAGLLFLVQGQWQALSALYGALISLSTTLLMSRGMQMAERLAGDDMKKMQAILYGGAAVRFILVIARPRAVVPSSISSTTSPTGAWANAIR